MTIDAEPDSTPSSAPYPSIKISASRPRGSKTKDKTCSRY